MKNTFRIAILLFISQSVFAQFNSNLSNYSEEISYTTQKQLSLIKIKEAVVIKEADIMEFINSVILTNKINKVAFLKSERDQLGFTNIKYTIFQNNILLANKIIIAHCLNGRLVSLNGDLADIPQAVNVFAISEKMARSKALEKVNAKKYKWENKAEEQHMREALGDAKFSYYPNAEKVVFEKLGKFYNAYQFNIYAEEPLYRANVFVDASTGKVLEEQNLICTTDVPASGNTKYSGNQSFTADSTASFYRLRETQRGLGVETYNMNNGTSYSSATDFTNSSTSWTTSVFDQGALDAHWGAEKTYDYFFTQYNRNSINNNGFKLVSYVHYQNNYSNAFWDGQRMTYGDGNGGSYKIFTALDVCGHEITHGLTSNTGNLTYSNESGALNESYSDIFGTAIENYARPGNWNWKIGEDLTNSGNGLRTMSNPNAFNDPDTYGGTYYYTGTADNGGVHTNSGVSNYWFYLLSSGGSGTNDLSNVFSVSAIGINDAAKIAFRALTVYFTPSTNFANARLLTIQAAKDLFGDCSNQVVQTTRAWYAVGVGANYVAGAAGLNFNSNITNFCSTPANVVFNNTSTNGLSYFWDFGDGGTATTINASHTYTAVGIYAVKLKAIGCSNVADSVIKTAFVAVNAPVNAPLVSASVTGCQNSSAILNGAGSATLKWYDSPTGGSELGVGSPFASPSLTSTTIFYAANTLTLAPVFGGITSFSGGGYSNVNTNYLIFDVSQNSVLNTVQVMAQTIGDRVIELRNSSNQVIHTKTVNVALGVNTITLNFNLTPGTNYQLGLNNFSTSSLYRTYVGAYPYNIGGCVSITGSNTNNNIYYFFYNWKISKEECASTRVPVMVTVNPAPAVAISVADSLNMCEGEVVDLQGTPMGGIYSGTTNGSIFSATNASGTYTVSYHYTDINSCSSSVNAVLKVDECTSLLSLTSSNNSILIYPNPTKEKLRITNLPASSKVMVTDASGRLMFNSTTYSENEIINLQALNNGLYILTVQDSSGNLLKNIKLIKE